MNKSLNAPKGGYYLIAPFAALLLVLAGLLSPSSADVIAESQTVAVESGTKGGTSSYGAGQTKLLVEVQGMKRAARIVVRGPLEAPGTLRRRAVRSTRTLSLPRGTYAVSARTAGAYVPRISGAQKVVSEKAPDVVRAVVELDSPRTLPQAIGKGRGQGSAQAVLARSPRDWAQGLVEEP